MDLSVLSRAASLGYQMHQAKVAEQERLRQQQGFRAQDEARQFGYDVQKTGLEHQNRLDEIAAQQQGQQDIRKIIEEGLNKRNQGKGALTPEKYSQIFQRTHAEFLKQYDAPTALQLTQAALSGMADMVGAGEPTATTPATPAAPALPTPLAPQPMGQNYPDVPNPTRFTSTDVRPPAVDMVMNAIRQVQPPSTPPTLGMDPRIADKTTSLNTLYDRFKSATDPVEKARISNAIDAERGRLDTLSSGQPAQMPANLSPSAQIKWLQAHGQLDRNAETVRHNKETEKVSYDRLTLDQKKFIDNTRRQWKSLNERERHDKAMEAQGIYGINQAMFRTLLVQDRQDARTEYTQGQENARAAMKGGGEKSEVYNAKVNQLKAERAFHMKNLQDPNFDDDAQIKKTRDRIAAINLRLQQLATEQDSQRKKMSGSYGSVGGNEADQFTAPKGIPYLPGNTPTGLPGPLPPAGNNLRLTTGPVNASLPSSLRKPTSRPRPSRTSAKKKGKTMADLFR